MIKYQSSNVHKITVLHPSILAPAGRFPGTVTIIFIYNYLYHLSKEMQPTPEKLHARF